MLRLLLLGEILLTPFLFYGQNFNEVGSEEAGLAYACTAREGPSSVFYNPGIVIKEGHCQVGLSYTNWLNLKGFATTSLAGHLKIKKGSLQIGNQYHGWKYMSANRLLLGAAYTLSERFQMGVSMSFFSLDFGRNYGRFQSLTGNIGICFNYSERIQFGCSVFNLKKKLPKGYSPLLTDEILRVGANIKAVEKVSLLIDAHIQAISGSSLSLSSAYEIHRSFQLLMGLRTLNRSLCFGFVYTKKSLRLSWSAIHVQRIGWVNSVGIYYQ